MLPEIGEQRSQSRRLYKFSTWMDYYFVSVEEVQDAYRMLTSLLAADEQERRRMRETTLFETLVVRLVNQ